MQAFDLVDTLVEINYAARSPQQLAANIARARVIYRPRGNFVIITAQRNDPIVHRAISQMVSENFPNCQRVYFVEGGEAAIVEKKSELIKRLGITDFTDNNRSILSKMKELKLGVKLWVMTKSSGRQPY